MNRYLGLLGFLVLSSGMLGCGGADSRADEEIRERPEDRVVAVRVWQTEAQEVVDRAVLPADLLPYRRGILAAEASGAVDSIRVEAGARLSAGQILADIDTRTLKQRLAEAEAIERQRQSRYQRAVKLFDRRSITEQNLQDALAEKEIAEARASGARLALEKSRVLAPWAGTLSIRRVEVGDYVVPGQPLFELVDLRKIRVRAPAPAADVPYLRVGLPVEIRLEVFPGEVFTGTVKRLSAELDAATRTLEVEAELANPDRRLVPGLDAVLELPRRVISEAVLVPLEALVEQETAQVVYVVEGEAGSERAARREVKVGLLLGDKAVIEAGVERGARVIVDGQRQVSPGQRVRLAE